MTSVVVHGWAEEPGVKTVGCPRGTSIRIFVYDQPVSVIRALKGFVGKQSGCMQEGRSRLMKSCTCEVSLSHDWMGKLVSVVPKALMKQFLNVWMALSAVLMQWLCGSTSWRLTCCGVR